MKDSLNFFLTFPVEMIL